MSTYIFYVILQEHIVVIYYWVKAYNNNNVLTNSCFILFGRPLRSVETFVESSIQGLIQLLSKVGFTSDIP